MLFSITLYFAIPSAKMYFMVVFISYFNWLMYFFFSIIVQHYCGLRSIWDALMIMTSPPGGTCSLCDVGEEIDCTHGVRDLVHTGNIDNRGVGCLGSKASRQVDGSNTCSGASTVIMLGANLQKMISNIIRSQLALTTGKLQLSGGKISPKFF